MRKIIGAVAALALISCAPYHPPIVPISGDATSLAMLTGHWEGDYHGTQSGRTGSISFTLHASGDSATGEVVMDDPLHHYIVRASDTPEQHRLHATKSQALFIRFVGVRDGSVYGRLEPYTAPDCDCVVSTGFTGHILGDTVSGTFFTEASNSLTQQGVWRAVRTKIVTTQP